MVLRLAKEVRQINSEIPIIFLTAKSMKEDVLEGFKLGADDYMSKPSVWKSCCCVSRLS